MRSRFAPRQRFIKTGSSPLLENEMFTFSGLNLVDPDEISSNNESPYGVNFRVFAPKDSTKRVAISKRGGYTTYSVPVSETLTGSQQSVTGAASQSFTLTTWLGMAFTPGSSSTLTAVDINVKNTASGTGPLIVEIRSDSSNSPSSTILASSSIPNSSLTSSAQYLKARFIAAPSLTSGTQYWIVAHIQSDGTNSYQWTSTTNATTAKTSTNSGNSWSSTSYDLNYKFYYSTAGKVLGQTRYYNTTQSPAEIFAFGTSVYSVNDNTGAVTVIKSGLSAQATYYRFVTVNNKLYYTNGVDVPQVWDGTTNTIVAGSPGVSSDIILHANRLFFLSASDPNHLLFSDAGAYETFQAVSFLYVPSPNTADPVQRGISYQNTLLSFTRNRKYVLQGTDLASFVLRESPAKKGISSAGAVISDGNFVYFLSDDGVYKYNGGTDILLSKKVEPLLANMASKTDPNMWIFDNKVYMSYRVTGASNKSDLLIYDTVYNTWLHDSNVYIEGANNWISQSDARRVITGSSLAGVLYFGETGTSDLGQAIAFEYRTKYFSFGHPAAQHRIKRLYPQFRAQDGTYSVNVQIDVDEQNSPTDNFVALSNPTKQWGQSGLLWGSVANGGSGLFWGNPILTLTRLSIGGANRKHQIRILQSGVDNPVDFLGLSMYIKQQKPV